MSVYRHALTRIWRLATLSSVTMATIYFPPARSMITSALIGPRFQRLIRPQRQLRALVWMVVLPGARITDEALKIAEASLTCFSGFDMTYLNQI